MMASNSNDETMSFRIRNMWPENISASRFLMSGAALQLIGNGILYPFYLCKTHLQTNTSLAAGQGNPFYHLVKQAQLVVSENGIRGLYRGYLWSTFGSFPGIITHVAVYATAKYQLSYNELTTTHSLFSHESDEHSESIESTRTTSNESPSIIPQYLIPMVSGLMAETAAVLNYVPQEVVAQRLQLSDSTVRLPDVIRTIYREGGIRSFWRGTFAAYASYLPSSGLWWGSYEAYKHLICRRKSRQNLLGYSIAGICGGVTTAMLTNPIDCVRTRIQTQKGTYGESKIIPVIKGMYRNEGLLAFSKGLGARISLLVMEGILFADFYEILMYFSLKS